MAGSADTVTWRPGGVPAGVSWCPAGAAAGRLPAGCAPSALPPPETDTGESERPVGAALVAPALRSTHPDQDGEQRAAAGGQVDERVQQVLVQQRVAEGAQTGQDGRQLQVHLVRLPTHNTCTGESGLR